MKTDDLIKIYEAELDQIVAQAQPSTQAPKPSLGQRAGNVLTKTGNIAGAGVAKVAGGLGAMIGGVGAAAKSAQRGSLARADFGSEPRTGAQIRAGIQPIKPVQPGTAANAQVSDEEQAKATQDYLAKVAKTTRQPVGPTNNTAIDTLLKNAGLTK
jgi:hypothetical protein